MTISSKIFDTLTALKFNDTITRLAEDVKNLAQEVKEIDRRLIRLETFVEIADKQRKLAHLD